MYSAVKGIASQRGLVFGEKGRLSDFFYSEASILLNY